MDEIKSVIVRRASAGATSQHVQTLGSKPDLVIRALSPILVIAIRTARVYVQSVVGLLGAGSITGLDQGMLPHEFAARLDLAMRLAVAIAGVTCLQNIAELFAQLDRKFPEIRA